MKVIASLLVVLMVMLCLAPAAAAAGSGQGGFMGLLVGCCFGIRSGAAYNDGKDLHWREWGMIIPFVNLVVSIMNGLDGMNGLTTADMAAQYGANYY